MHLEADGISLAFGFLDKKGLVRQLLKLMERIILRFPPNVSDGFSQITMNCANQMFAVSPIGFCLLEMAEAKMLTLGGKSFLRLDEVKLSMVERPTLTALARRASIQSIRRLVALEAFCDTREEGLQLVGLLAACRWSSLARISVTRPMVGLNGRSNIFLHVPDLFFRAQTGGTGWQDPLGEVWGVWAGLSLAGLVCSHIFRCSIICLCQSLQCIGAFVF